MITSAFAEIAGIVSQIGATVDLPTDRSSAAYVALGTGSVTLLAAAVVVHEILHPVDFKICSRGGPEPGEAFATTTSTGRSRIAGGIVESPKADAPKPPVVAFDVLQEGDAAERRSDERQDLACLAPNADQRSRGTAGRFGRR